MSSVEDILKPFRYYCILIGDLGIFLTKSAAPSVTLIIIANLFTILNLVLHFYSSVVELNRIYDNEKYSGNMALVLVCLSMWTVVALAFHMVFSTRRLRFETDIKLIDKLLTDIRIPLKYKKLLLKVKFHVLVSLAMSFVQPTVTYFAPCGLHIYNTAILSWVSSNIVFSSVFLTVLIHVKLIAGKFDGVNDALQRVFVTGKTKVDNKDRVNFLCKCATIHQLSVDATRELNYCTSMQVKEVKL